MFHILGCSVVNIPTVVYITMVVITTVLLYIIIIIYRLILYVVTNFSVAIFSTICIIICIIYILYPISQNWFTLTNESTPSQVSGSNPAQHFARAEWAMVLRPSLGYGGVLPGLGRLLHETDAIRTSLTEIGLQLDPMNTPEGRDPLGQNFFHGYQSNAQFGPPSGFQQLLQTGAEKSPRMPLAPLHCWES